MIPASIRPGIVQETADLEGGRRRFRRGFAWSFGVHVLALAALGLLSLLTVERIPPPPLTIRFFALPPPAPRLVPPRAEEPAKRPPRRAPAHPADMIALRLPPPEPPPEAPRVRPEPLPERLEPQALPIHVHDAAPAIAVHDAAPGVASAPALSPVGSPTRPRAGDHAEPEVAFLAPGQATPHDPGAHAGGGLPGEPGGDPIGGIRRGGAGPDAAAVPMVHEPAFAGAGLASFLGRKYGVHLLEASRLGSRTSEGSRYALVLPALSEAYRGVTVRGRLTTSAGDEVESLLVDKESIAIRYRDGTVHVLAPTDDGLVALYVSAAGAESRSKVDEAERALEALRRLGRAGGGR
jgi:hypothetical protein